MSLKDVPIPDPKTKQGDKPRASAAAHPLDFGKAWANAPAPETADHVKIQPRYELFIGGKWVAPKSKKYFDTVSPSTEEKLAEVAEANAADVDAAVAAARTGYEKYWSKLRPIERGKYIYRIARALQEKARELAIVESMDGGKPIKESRDVDVPLAAAHFFLLRGLGRQARVQLPGRKLRALGVAGQVIQDGTSRCSWPRGSSRPRSPPATPACSSPPRRRRSPRSSSRRSSKRRICRPAP